MKKVFISGIIGTVLIFAVFSAACSNSAATKTAETSNAAVAANGAMTDTNVALATNAAKASASADAIKVTVSKNGFEPSEIKVEKGKPAKLAFYRADAENCASEVVFSRLNITKKLPVGETVLIEFTPTDSGEISFACGMNMLKGKVIVN